MLLDFSRPPNSREREVLQGRLERLSGGLADSTGMVLARVNALGAPGHLSSEFRLRQDFVYRPDPASGDASDRRLPPRTQRPSATRIMSSKGAALRFYLTVLGLAQILYRANTRPPNTFPLRGQTPSELGWIDLLASPSRAAGSGRLVMTVRDKKLRQLHAALGALAAAGLVSLPNIGDGRDKHENFLLLHEIGARYLGESLEYTVPGAAEVLVKLPASFLLNGWVHVLEDCEIAVLLMVACGRGRLPNEELIAIPGTTRLLHYGIGRDAFEAHKMLERLGLLAVQEVGRHEDGRAQDFGDKGSSLHRLGLLQAGFEEDAVEKLRSVLQYQLGRS